MVQNFGSGIAAALLTSLLAVGLALAPGAAAALPRSAFPTTDPPSARGCPPGAVRGLDFFCRPASGIVRADGTREGAGPERCLSRPTSRGSVRVCR